MAEENKYLSIITNFGCHYTCPYCIVKNNHIDIPKTTLGGLDKLAESIEKYGCNWVSISGGGDPLFESARHGGWWSKLFKITRDVKRELHTSYLYVPHHLARHFDRIVYHCQKPEDLFLVNHDPGQYMWRSVLDQKTRVVFVVTEDFTPKLIDEIAGIVKHNPYIDELSFRQMVDKNYEVTHYCEDYLRAGHQKDWWYIEQNDYNIYYAENKVSFRYQDFVHEESECACERSESL